MKEYSVFCREINLYFPELGLRVAEHVSEGNIKPVDCYREAPTLAELRQLGKMAQSKQIRLCTERGEWTADFVNYSYKYCLKNLMPGYILCELISRPEKVYKKGSTWIALGGLRKVVKLPPSGWVVPDLAGRIYDETTGLPLKTVWDLQKALQEAGPSLYSFFWRAEKGDGLKIINRECERFLGDLFEISIIQSPDFSHPNIGVRCIEKNFTE